MTSRARTYSPYAVDAARLLGAQVASARRERRWTRAELAERAGISPTTLSKVERGELTVSLGVTFDVAALVGVPLFNEDRSRLSGDLDRTRDRLALLPQRVRKPSRSPNNDF
jgi:transcriptional regulator with XRE-family HTH domain